jgi:hypothetical protein
VSWVEFGNIAFYSTTVVSVLFALLYMIFAPWWKTFAGRNIMAVMGSMAVAFGYFTWVINLGHVPPGFMPMRALIFTAIALSIGWRTVIFIRFHIIRSLRAGKGRQDELEDSR